jgi:hypothetical protein
MSTGDNNHVLTNLSVPVSPETELGHQKMSPLRNIIAYSVTRGFLGNTILRILMPDSQLATRMKLALGSSLLLIADDFVNYEASKLSYEHEFAREEWEHEFNAIGEVDEYVNYAVGRGVSPDRARELALVLTSEPRVSVPYHLAFELGLLEPPSLRRELIYATISGISQFGGALISEVLVSCSRLLVSHVWKRPISDSLTIAVACVIGVLPILGYRFREVARVRGSRNFEMKALAVFAGCIGATTALGRIRNK